ncbi:MAG: hypothetical protein ABI418_16325 [Jatrophihabitantaceae bacterium]
MTAPVTAPVTWCPSGQPDAPEAVVLGVRSGPAGEVSYLAEPVPAAEVLGEIPEGIEPTRVLRFATHCFVGCMNRRGDDCSLVERVVTIAPTDPGSSVPRCHLRPRCQWWAQSGVLACHRCPAVSTAIRVDDPLAVLVADPATTQAQLDGWIAESS